MTLAFLGSRPEEEIPQVIASALTPVAGWPAPRMTPSGVVPVPRRPPRLFALDLADSGEVHRVQQAVAGTLERAGLYSPERRPFWPHLTLARVRGGGIKRRGSRGGRTEPLEGTPPFDDLLFDRVTVYRSRLSPRGARYEVLESVTLAR